MATPPALAHTDLTRVVVAFPIAPVKAEPAVAATTTATTTLSQQPRHLIAGRTLGIDANNGPTAPTAARRQRSAILLGMATRADFTDEEWKAMQEGITGAGLFVALVDRGFFDSFKEANALAHHLRDAHEHSDSVLVRDLATGHDRPFGMTASPAEVEQTTVTTLQQAVAALGAKSPEDLPAYKQLVLEVAQSVAEAAKGVSTQENQALDSIRAALGS